MIGVGLISIQLLLWTKVIKSNTKPCLHLIHCSITIMACVLVFSKIIKGFIFKIHFCSNNVFLTAG